MVESLGYATLSAAKWVVALVGVLAIAVAYPVVVRRRPTPGEAAFVRAACARAGLDPRVVRVAREGTLGPLGVSYSSLVPGLGVVTVSERALDERDPDLLAAGASLWAGRRRRRYLATGFGFAVLWVEYGASLALAVAAPAGTNWAAAVPLGVLLGLGPLAAVAVGLWFVAFCRGVDRTLARVGPEPTLRALERGRRSANSRVTRYLYARSLETLVDGRFGPGRDVAWR